MAQVLNTEERTYTFWKFLLFFLVTVTVITFAIFFDFRMPVTENSKLKDEIFLLRQASAVQDGVAGKLDMIMSLLDSIEKKGGDREFLFAKYNTVVADLNETTGDQIKTSDGRINKQLVALLLKVKQQNFEIDQKNKDLKVNETKINDLNSQLKIYKDDVNSNPVQTVN